MMAPAPRSLILALVAISGVAADEDGPIPAKIEFNRDVRPILSDTCFLCHGPDPATRQANLRLDTLAGLLGAESGPGNGPSQAAPKDGSNSPATTKGATRGTDAKSGKGPVVPGKPAESELYRRITSMDADERMPPADHGKQLRPRQIEVIKRWIEQGAAFEGHWAYQPIRRVEPPNVERTGFVRGPIDRFILARLRAEGLTPAPIADRRTLARRLAFDLTGLPPTHADVTAFANDRRPDALERYVDGLLASPAHAERLTVWWLDLVRYADTIGYHSDNPMNVYPYRDRVIRAFANNEPFDRFTIEQIAGDLLPNPTQEQKLASAYNRILQTTEEGGAQPREYVEKYSADRVRNIGSVWLGSTLGCAQCHDHKYDPISTRDFYSMAAFFADIQEAAVGKREPGMPVLSSADETELKRIDANLLAAIKRLDKKFSKLDLAPLEARLKAAVTWKPLPTRDARVRGESHLHLQPDGSFLQKGKVAAKETFEFTVEAPAEGITGIRLHALADTTLPGKGPGSSPNGNFVLTEVLLEAVGADGKPARVPITRSVADHSQQGYPVANAHDGDPGTGWAILPKTGASHEAVFEFSSPISKGPATLRLAFDSPFPQHVIGRPKLEFTSAPAPARGAVPDEVLVILKKPAKERTQPEAARLADWLRENLPELSAERADVVRLDATRRKFLNEKPKCLVTEAGPPRTIRILPRGNYLDESGAVVEPAVPAFLPGPRPTPGRRLTRLDLARWLVAPENPLTARVIVNQLWKLHFGAGLARNADELGSQGEWPTHPELLDWLADDFRASGWNVRRLIRTMVLSGAYLQASDSRPELSARDPFNRLLGRQNRVRLDAEFVRDQALAVSGLLVRTVGGPSVKPYQPEGYWSQLNFPIRNYVADKGDSQYRRGMYTHWQRTFPHPSMVAFDAPSREEGTCDRPRSNIPQQALVLLNDPTYVESARGLAERILRESEGTDEARVRTAFRLALQRDPEADEAKLLGDLVRRHRRQLESDPKGAAGLVSVGHRPGAKDLDPVTLAAWTSVARTLLNLHETLTRL